MTIVPLYDEFSQDYDRFVDWEARLSVEMPFFRALFERNEVRRVLDVACGTGHHAIALARQGYQVTATDASQGMIERARANVASAGVDVRLLRLGFGQLAGAVPDSYQAILCLGNSLPHLTTEEALTGALSDFRSVLAPGGLVIIQNRNLDRVLARRERFMPLTTHHLGDQEWMFIRFYDFQVEEIQFNLLRLHRRGEAEWTMSLTQTRLRAWRRREMSDCLSSVGLQEVEALGSYGGEPFDPASSGDLVLIARRSETG